MSARLGVAFAAMLSMVFAGMPDAKAQSYPSRLIRIVVPATAGGPLDLVTRAAAEKVAAALGQPIVIENKPGASGNVGADQVVKSAADGYTLLSALGTTMTVNPHVYKAMPFDPQKDLRPVTTLAAASQMLVVHKSLPVNSLAEFVALAKKEPQSYAHAGPGSPGHLAMEYFKMKAGIADMNAVPYRGNAQLNVDLASGQIKIGFVSTSGIIQHVQAGALKAFAVSSKARSALAPDVPTIAEIGYPGFEFVTNFVLMAPAGTPDAIVETLEREFRKALLTDEMKTKFAPVDTAILGLTAAETGKVIRTDYELWAEVAKAANMKLD